MSFIAKPKFKTVAQLKANLDELTAKVERQAKREAVRKAAGVFLRSIRDKAPQRTGLLRKSLKVKVSTFKKGKMIVATVGPDRNVRGKDEKGRLIRPVHYAHLQEFGTARQDAEPFMRPAFDESKQAALDTYAKDIGPAIQRVARRINRKVPV